MRHSVHGSLTPAPDRAAILSSDLCLNCNICTAACPVMATSDEFQGPKAVGPMAQRFRHPRLPIPENSLSWCSGCGICSQVCPHGVQVAEINLQAKARLAEQAHLPVRDHLLARPQLLGKLARPAAGLVNSMLRSSLVRKFMDRVMKIDARAPLPAFSARPLRRRLANRDHKRVLDENDSKQTVAYFHGCSTAYFEPELGELTVRVLETLGYSVILPPQNCCGHAMQSNGIFRSARRAAEANIKKLHPFVEAGIPLIGTSPSCTLAFKHDYSRVLGVGGREAQVLAEATRDVFEFLVWDEPDSLDRVAFEPVESSVLYHPPCLLGSHGIGTPALNVLRRIPGLDLHLSRAACCGAAGTYGLKSERFEVARNVGETLFRQAIDLQVDVVATDSETCRWWIEAHSGVKSLHPIELFALSLGLSPGR